MADKAVEVSAAFRQHPFPAPLDWEELRSAAKRDVYRFSRLWLTEGLPYAFRDAPLAYERARERLAEELRDDPKHISVTGSGRVGFSMSPETFGRPFGMSSDLDLFIVSPVVFAHLCTEAKLFRERYAAGLAKPRTNAEAKFWPANVTTLAQQEAKGLIDHRLIPIGDYYPWTKMGHRGLERFNYAATGKVDGGGRYRGSTLRVYRDWDRAIAQIGGSLVSVLERRGCKLA
ncbi:MAG: hypothetical protein ACTHLT_14885 [Devosia sp.]